MRSATYLSLRKICIVTVFNSWWLPGLSSEEVVGSDKSSGSSSSTSSLSVALRLVLGCSSSGGMKTSLALGDVDASWICDKKKHFNEVHAQSLSKEIGKNKSTTKSKKKSHKKYVGVQYEKKKKIQHQMKMPFLLLNIKLKSMVNMVYVSIENEQDFF